MTVGIAAAVWAVMLLAQGVTLKTSYLRPYSLAVGVVIVILLVFDRWLWRIRLLARVWVEVYECKYLFSPGQAWSCKDGRDLAKAAWNCHGYR